MEDIVAYHYTSVEKFEKIIESNFLRFSRLEDANDKRERYAGLNDDIFSSHYYISTCAQFNNAAMWYHYANKHNGVCIEFKFPAQTFEVVSIDYETPYSIDKNKIGITPEEAKEYLSHKSKCWIYEEEKRLFYIKKDKKQDKEDYYGMDNCLDYIGKIILGNNVNVDNLSEKTISFLKSIKGKNELYVISWEREDGRLVECLNPSLT